MVDVSFILSAKLANNGWRGSGSHRDLKSFMSSRTEKLRRGTQRSRYCNNATQGIIITSQTARMKLSIAFICIAITAACGGTNAQEIIPSLRGSFLDVFESSCPATCRSSRYRNHNDDCSHCLGNPDCYTFNGALDGFLSGGRCC